MHRKDNISRQIVKKQGWGEPRARREDRLVGRFVNQGSDHSLHNNTDIRESDTLLGKYVSSPDEINQHNEFGIVRTSDESSSVEQPPQFTNSVLQGHF